MPPHEFHDFYEILQVHPKASLAVIKKAYRTLLLELGNHPDQGGDRDTAALITEAYHVLSDPDRRVAYDREYFGQQAAPGPRADGPRPAPASASAASGLIALCPRCNTKNRVRSQELLAVAKCSKCGQSLSRVPNPLVETKERLHGFFQRMMRSVPPKQPGKLREAPKVISLGIPLLLIGISLAGGAYALSDMFGGLGDPIATATQLKKEGKLDQAAVRLQRAVDRDPGNPRLYELLGDVYDKQGEPTQALAQYAAAIKLNPTNAYYWDLEGGIYQKLGRMPEAETCFRQAIKVDPQYATALVALGNLEAKNQRFDDANKHYEEALRTHPTADVYYNIGLVKQWQGRTDEAITAFNKALMQDPDNRPSMVNLASLYYERHQYDQAAAQLIKASHLRHADLDLHLRLAEIYERTGNKTAAIKEWTVCLEQGKGNPLVVERVKKALGRLGKLVS
jgi:tetratricopeptide (TPR) repeat protein